VARIVIRFAESAIQDLEAIRDWYEEQGVPDVGQKILAKIITRIEALKVHPDLGRVVPEFGQSFLRELISPPFRIVYRRDAHRVRVVRIWRSERTLILPEDAE
jgi:plasmid stabilization system protein ParE